MTNIIGVIKVHFQKISGRDKIHVTLEDLVHNREHLLVCGKWGGSHLHPELLFVNHYGVVCVYPAGVGHGDCFRDCDLFFYAHFLHQFLESEPSVVSWNDNYVLAVDQMGDHFAEDRFVSE